MAQRRVRLLTEGLDAGSLIQAFDELEADDIPSLAASQLVAISASDHLFSSGSVVLSGNGNVTIGTAGQTILISAGGGAETQTFVGGLANSETTYTSGTILMSGLGNITVRSTTGQAFQFSVPAQSVQAETQTFLGALANSQTTYTSGTVLMSGLGAVTIDSTTGQALRINVPVQSVQPETQTFIGGVAMNAATTYTSGTVVLSAGANITLGSAGQTVTISGVASQTVQTQNMVALSASNALFTSGTVVISGFGDVTVNTAAGTIRISAPVQSVQAETQTFVGGVGNSQTTYTSGTINLSVNGGLLTIRSTTGNAFQFSVSQSVQAETQTFVGGLANSQTTYTSGTVSLSELGAITIRSTTGNQFQLSVNSQTVQTQNMVDMSLAGNTAGVMALVSSGTVVLAGGNNITLSQNGQSVTISAPNLGAGAFSGGVSNLGNSAGATGVTGTRMVWVGSNNITLSQTTDAGGGTISILGQPSYSMGASNLGNTAGSTGVSGTRNVLVGTNEITLSQSTDANGATISIIPEGYVSRHFAHSVALFSSTTFAHADSAMSLIRMELPHAVSFTRVDIPLKITLATAATTATAALNLSAVAVLYSRSVSTLSPIVGMSSTTTYTWASNTGVYSSLTGQRVMSYALATRLSAGEYYLGIQFSTGSTSSIGLSTTALRGTIAMIFGTQMTNSQFADMSALTATSINALEPMAGQIASLTATSVTRQASQVSFAGHAIPVIFRNK